MKYKRFILPALLAALSLGSCKTLNEYPVSSDEHHRQFADVSMSLRYIDRDELIARHGREANPFIDFPGGIISHDNIMVFELNMESTETAVVIKQKAMTLSFDTISNNPISEYLMKEKWEGFHNDSRQQDQRNKIIGDNLRQGLLEVDPETPLSCYIVFVGNFPLYGDAKITMPIATADLKDNGIIEFPFSFSLAYIDPDKADGFSDHAVADDAADDSVEKKSIFSE